MITNIKNLEKYCTDYTKIKNYDEAIKSPLIYDLHHRLEIDEMQSRSDLIFLHLYYNRPPEELVFLEHGEHSRLHNLNSSEETRHKISESNKGKPGHWLGKHLSAAARKKISATQKGNQNALGHHCSEDTKQKISDAMKGKNVGKPGTCLGKHWHLENGKHVYTD